MEIAPWDTVCGIEYDRLRPLTYPDTDVILLCFSLDSQLSVRNIENIWLPEIKLFCPNVPIILIGNKKDLRDQVEDMLAIGTEGTAQENEKKAADFISHEQGKELANKIGAFAYLECSCKTMDGISIVFPTAGRAALQVSSCCKYERNALIVYLTVSVKEGKAKKTKM